MVLGDNILFRHGPPDPLLDAGNFVRTLTESQGMQTGSPDEIAFQQGWIDAEELKSRAEVFKKNTYGHCLSQLAESG